MHLKYIMTLIIQKLRSIERNKCSYVTATDDVQLNWWNNEWEWWSMKVSASKMWNFLNHTNLHSIGKTALILLLWMIFNWINKKMNESDEVLILVHQKYGMSGIMQKIHSIRKKLLSSCCHQRCLIESTKQRMKVMKYEGDCIKNMEWAES